MIHLSNRLRKLASYVSTGSVMADIGTDHGYLPVYLVSQGICTRAVAADINKGPLESARAHVEQYQVSGKIDLRLGNGLERVQPGEVDTIVIAGMGGGTIRDILQASPETAVQARRLILQPMADEAELRNYLVNHGWSLVDEELLLEDNRLYLILVAERGREEIAEPLLFEVGPRLLEKKHPLLPVYLQRLQQKYQRILDGLAKSSQPTVKEKAAQIERKIAKIEKLTQGINLE
ncbi:tRNA (adenine(22)-N(1))-methyltransferase [Desulforamulus aeronauticus]|uniref:tRNA (Adenine22-N1)-methyltransferase n=1 Tax=Desulforamulus aeronauticus DSM 10349 TaxID=1121421 RepID=A0A1M6VGB1_9FIRM|nr:class I SAM-dependent methyltransferase [Desulforamulus aeronauticus]SHK80543.1 tRNA (adenine22-N1)-methyltransferase [Desulforamulus aeronauticus DSM 10349]